MAAIQSVVTREKSLHDVNPALASQHSDLNHRFMVVHLVSGQAKTVEYGHFHGGSTGEIRTHDGAQTIHAMLEAHEFETEGPKVYTWDQFHHWVIHESGYQNTPWTPDHQSETFIKDCLDHIISNTVRPAHVAALQANSALDVKEPTAEAQEVFRAVKVRLACSFAEQASCKHEQQHDVIKKLHQLHKMDATHHTHIFDEATHLSSYKLVQFGTREVEYGTIFIGKIGIGNGHFLHVRVHKFHSADPPLEFHSIRMTRDSGIWSDKAPLVFFEE
ncbi:hypothetical protein HDU83_008581 [Entophlyctis luteolus]|nr:hypothetical protein HDU83_008581 [Entophlyctis luteolus]